MPIIVYVIDPDPDERTWIESALAPSVDAVVVLDDGAVLLARLGTEEVRKPGGDSLRSRRRCDRCVRGLNDVSLANFLGSSMMTKLSKAVRSRAIPALVAAALLAGCAGNGGGMGGGVMQTDTGKGALFGGAGGALIGGLVDHADPAVGILIGAAGGALLGGLVGHHMDTQRQNLAKALQPEINAGDVSLQLLQNNAIRIDMTGATRFAPGSAVVNPAFLSTLQQVASVARTYGKVTITVIGHPDPGGTWESRERLANQRAEAIRVQLLGMGVPPILVSASGDPRSTWEDGRTQLMIYPVVGG